LSDKNDDGCLSREEFKSYFSDPLVTDAELMKLFDLVDSNKDGSIQVEELCERFSSVPGFNHIDKLYSTLTSLHEVVSPALAVLSESYETADSAQKFCIRFLLKEFMDQIQSLHRPVDSAHQSFQLNLEVSAQVPVSHSKHYQEENHSPALGGSLDAQVAKLEKLVSKLSQNELRLNTTLNFSDDNDVCLLVSRSLLVDETQLDSFYEVCRTYMKTLRQSKGSLHQYVLRKPDTNHFLLYEVWAKDKHLKAHYSTPLFRNFAKQLVDVLQEPIQTQVVTLPVAWFDKDDQ